MCRTLQEALKQYARRAVMLAMSCSTLPVFAYQPVRTDATGRQGGATQQLEFALHAERHEGVFAPARQSNDEQPQTRNRLASAGLTWRVNSVRS